MISAKKMAFLTENKAKLCKILILTLVFEKNAIFSPKNWRKSQKIEIITSTPRRIWTHLAFQACLLAEEFAVVLEQEVVLRVHQLREALLPLPVGLGRCLVLKYFKM
jgi:hypothetical protein